MELQVYVDASSFDDGRDVYGYVILGSGETIAEGQGYLRGHLGSNSAESVAADLGLRVIRILASRKHGEAIQKITVYSDSRTLVESNKLQPPFIKGSHYSGRVTTSYRIPVEYHWIPSNKNIADKLVSDPKKRERDAYFRSLREGAKFKVGDIVEVKPDAPGYTLWYKNKAGVVANLEFHDNGELRYKVDFGDEILPFGEWELKHSLKNDKGG